MKNDEAKKVKSDGPNENSVDRRQDLWIAASFIVSLISLVVSILAAIYSREQAIAAKEVNDRASGRLRAELALLDSIPTPESLAPAKRKKIFDSNLETFFAATPDDLVELNTQIILQNVGKEPIDAIRVTVAYDKGTSGLDLFELAAGSGKDPIIIEQLHREEHVLDQKLGSGEVVIFPITKGLLHQMLQGQRGQPQKTDRYGEFIVRCSGRIVGGSSFDMLVDDRILRIRLLWAPEGFPEQSVNQIITSFRPKVEIQKTTRNR